MRGFLKSFMVAVLGAVVGGIGVTVLAATAAPVAAATATPQRVITVQATSAQSTTARLDLWQTSGRGGYWHAAGPYTAYVGELGIGHASEGSAHTPAGVFTLTQAFGNQPSNGTTLPYFRAGPSDWWDGESGTPAYNTHVRQAASPGGASENLYTAGAVYAHAVVIDYNRFPVVAGAGSAFFLHVTNGRPTAGCVAISAASLDVVMRWLTPAAHPVISIGVGAQATSLITDANAAAALRNPRGNVDSVTAGAGTAKVVGWAADPDALSTRLQVDVYVDKKMRARVATGLSRPDVARAIGAGPNQGFGYTATKLARGAHSVCAYALNIGKGTANPNLGCRTVTVR